MQRCHIEALSAWQQIWTVLSEARKLLSDAAPQAAMHGDNGVTGGMGKLFKRSCERLLQMLVMLSQVCAEDGYSACMHAPWQVREQAIWLNVLTCLAGRL